MYSEKDKEWVVLVVAVVEVGGGWWCGVSGKGCVGDLDARLWEEGGPGRGCEP